MKKFILSFLTFGISIGVCAEVPTCLKELTDMEVMEVIEKHRKLDPKLPRISESLREVKIEESFCHYRYIEYVKESIGSADKPIAIVVSKRGVIVDYVQGRLKQSLVACRPKQIDLKSLKTSLEKSRNIFPKLPNAQADATFEQTKMRCFDVINENGVKKIAYIFDSYGDFFSFEEIH